MSGIAARSFFILDKKSIVLFFLMISHPVLVIFLSFFSGLHSFESSGLVNKVWFLVVVVLLFPVIMDIILKPGLYVFLMFFFAVYGLVLGNSLLSVISDFSLFLLPYLFFRYWLLVGSLEVQLRVICESLFLVVLFGLVVFLPAKISGISFYFDYVLILSFAVSGFLLKNYQRIFFILASFSAPLSKTMLVGVLLGVFVAFRATLKNKLILIFCGGVVFWVLIYFSNEKVLVFLDVFLNFKEMVSIYGFSSFYNPFDYFDVSTAHRIYEMMQILEVNFSNFLVFFLGQGFGGGVDLSYSSDSSVAVSRSLSDLASVRVIHLGLASIFLKFGFLGLIAALYMFVSWSLALYRARSNDFISENLLVMLRLSLAMYLIGCFFTFGNYFKQPGFGIVLAMIYMQFMLVDKGRLERYVN